MAKKQSRRSISVNRSLFDQATEAAKARGIPLAQLNEKALRAELVGSGDVPAEMFTGQEADMMLRGLAALDQMGKVHPNDKPRFDALKARVLKASSLPANLAPTETTAQNAENRQTDGSDVVQAPDGFEVPIGDVAQGIAVEAELEETAADDTHVEYDEVA